MSVSPFLRAADFSRQSGGIDRRSLIAASLAAIVVRGLGGPSPAKVREPEFIIVDGWILSANDLAAPDRSVVNAG